MISHKGSAAQQSQRDIIENNRCVRGAGVGEEIRRGSHKASAAQRAQRNI